MVFPIPRSSLSAGITILTFRITHSRIEYKNKVVKREEINWTPFPDEVPYVTYYPVTLPKITNRDWKKIGAVKYANIAALGNGVEVLWKTACCGFVTTRTQPWNGASRSACTQ